MCTPRCFPWNRRLRGHGENSSFLTSGARSAGEGALREDFGGREAERDPRKIDEEAVLNLKPVR